MGIDDLISEFGKEYREFLEPDPFNEGNEVGGYISQKPNEYYGAMVITIVNGKAVAPQMVMGSPKMHYPFEKRDDGERRYVFPPARYIEIYEKLDGTNILAYYYYGENGERYLSFKTRLRPFVRSGRFGDFEGMWKEVGLPYADIMKRLMQDMDCNLSFEMYGSRNTHLVVYDMPLAIAFLFGVTNVGRILSPSAEPVKYEGALPVVRRLQVIERDYVWNYEETRRKLQAGLKQVDDEHYSGVEGAVWYLHLAGGRCIQIKCKPEDIEAIHFAAGAHMSKNSIIATCWNAFENVDTLSFAAVKELLVEEWDEAEIEANRGLVRNCISLVTEEAEFRRDVVEAYRATGLNVRLNKAEVMRDMADRYPKSKMRKVYSIIDSFA